LAANLVQLLPRRIKERLTVSHGLTDRRWTDNISGSLSPVAIAEFLELWEATEHVQLTDQEDKTIWRWTADGTYTVKSAYMMLHGGSIPFQGHSLIWKT
jgi:hypothetical protein